MVKRKKKTLLELRTELNLSRGEVSKKCFIEQMALYHYENMSSLPNIIDALILAKFYNKRVSEIQWSR